MLVLRKPETVTCIFLHGVLVLHYLCYLKA